MSHADGILARLSQHDMATLTRAMQANDLKAVESLKNQKNQPSSSNTAG